MEMLQLNDLHKTFKMCIRDRTFPLPAECYQGGDIKVLAGEFADINGDKYVAACSGLSEDCLLYTSRCV